MGSPLSVTLANFFMAHVERQIMLDNDIVRPHVYVRYIDDVFAMFSNVTDHIDFLNVLNNQHPNLKFTVEFGGKSIAFLDVKVSIENANFETWVFRKEINTNVMLNKIAVCPIQWKTGLITCLLNRAWLVCSNYNRLHQEFDNLRSIFVQNGYTQAFFDKVLKRFLYRKVTESNNKTNDTDNCKQERYYVLKVPFIGKPSLLFKQRFTRLIKSINTTGINMSIVFTSCKVKDFFSLKSKCSDALRSYCVYKFTCRSDSGLSYIGQTSRHLGVRVKEHLNIRGENPSAVGRHILGCSSCRNSLENGELAQDGFSVIKSGRSRFETEILEALLINKHNPKINKQGVSAGFALTLNVFR